jgi:hypothetical protein
MTPESQRAGLAALTRMADTPPTIPLPTVIGPGPDQLLQLEAERRAWNDQAFRDRRTMHARKKLPGWLSPVRAVLLAAGTAIAVIAGTGGGFALAAQSAPKTAPPGAIFGCVTYGSRVLEHVYTVGSNFPGCPSGSFAVTVESVAGKTGPAGPQGPAGPAGPQGPAGSNGTNGTNGASYQPVTASAQTDITNDQDSGNHGNWAVDTITRQITVTRHGQVAVSHCGGTATNGITTCWYYTALMTDTGSFTTDSGASSPQAGAAINGVVSGTISGGSSYEFYASGGAPDGTLVPATLDASSSGTNSGDWPERFFPAGTSFGGMNEINWSYTYNAPATCETWTDAFDNSGGSLAADGDIAGVNACKAS